MPPATTAPRPTTASSSTSAPVKGKLVGVDNAGVATPGVDPDDPPVPDVPVNGSALPGAWPFELAAMTGTVEQPTPDVEPHPAAPATDGTATREATAKPVPINKPLAHMMVALLPVGDMPLRAPR